ncbi:MAG: hypothetical protein LIP08_09600 [Bacteroides sp.]|nr:hypothetical protein [Bacteroides sp.]
MNPDNQIVPSIREFLYRAASDRFFTRYNGATYAVWITIAMVITHLLFSGWSLCQPI